MLLVNVCICTEFDLRLTKVWDEGSTSTCKEGPVLSGAATEF